MKRFAIDAGLILALAVTLATGCESQQMVTSWSADTATVDGKMTEWAESPLTIIRDTNVRVAMRNDDATLYLLVCCSDAATVRSIQMSGMTVWLDASGKKKKDFGLRFIGGPSFEDLKASGLMSKDDLPGGAGSGRGAPFGHGEGASGQSQTQQRPPMAGRAELAFIDKKNDATTDIAVRGDDGPAAKCGVTKGLCLYEFSIPLKSEDSGDVVLAVKPGGKLSVGLEWGGAPEGKRPSGGGPGGGDEGMGLGGGFPGGGSGGGPGGGPGGMPPGGGPGGGFPGGGPGGDPRGGAQFAEKQQVWLKTVLAIPPAAPAQ